MDILNNDELLYQDIKNGLLKLNQNIDILFYESIDSTNSHAKRIAQNTPKDAILIAKQQSAGRGSGGRSFLSKNGGIYMSFLLHPNFTVKKALFLTSAAAVAVSLAIEEVLKEAPKIKWVNDIYLNGKKICGILTESLLTANKTNINYAVVGLGLNVYMPKGGYPEKLQNIAGALANYQSQTPGLLNKLCISIAYNFLKIYNNFNPNYIHTAYKQRLLGLNKKVTVLINNTQKDATIINLTPQNQLVLQFLDNTTRTIESGEIKILYK